ncbi:hypothetical protein O0544_06945 [Edwardsiella anguillarum]|nr:hypothetical protein [Edwardsiella anguillarum]
MAIKLQIGVARFALSSYACVCLSARDGNGADANSRENESLIIDSFGWGAALFPKVASIYVMVCMRSSHLSSRGALYKSACPFPGIYAPRKVGTMDFLLAVDWIIL